MNAEVPPDFTPARLALQRMITAQNAGNDDEVVKIILELAAVSPAQLIGAMKVSVAVLCYVMTVHHPDPATREEFIQGWFLNVEQLDP